MNLRKYIREGTVGIVGDALPREIHGLSERKQRGLKGFLWFSKEGSRKDNDELSSEYLSSFTFPLRYSG